MAKILVLSLVYSPDTVSTANLVSDVARGLQQRGHQVTVLTSIPHYNPSTEVSRNPIYRPPFWRLCTDVVQDGVRVLRLYMPLKGQRVWRRLFDYAWFQSASLLLAIFKAGRHDLVLVVSPPISLGVSGYIIATAFRAPLVYNLQELYPDLPIRLGLIKNRFLIHLVYGLERFVYQKSAAITAVSRAFIENLASRNVPREKLFFAPNFVDVNWLIPGSKQNSFAREHGLEDKFVVFYAGNVGLTQGLNTLVDVARELETDREIRIVVVGDGVGRLRLQRGIKDSGLNNILLLRFEPYSRVPETYATADVCVSPMRSGFSHDITPSKIYTAMAAGRPVVAACEPDTESAQLLRESNGGIIVKPESASEMAAAIRALRASPEQRLVMGKSAREWIVKYYSREAVIAVYDEVIRHLGAPVLG